MSNMVTSSKIAKAVDTAIKGSIAVTPTDSRDVKYLNAICEELSEVIFGKSSQGGNWSNANDPKYWIYQAMHKDMVDPATGKDVYLNIALLFKDGTRGYLLEGYRLTKFVFDADRTQHQSSKDFIENINNRRELEKKLNADVKKFLGFSPKDPKAAVLLRRSRALSGLLGHLQYNLQPFFAGAMMAYTSGNLGWTSPSYGSIVDKTEIFKHWDTFSKVPANLADFIDSARTALIQGKPVTIPFTLEAPDKILNPEQVAANIPLAMDLLKKDLKSVKNIHVEGFRVVGKIASGNLIVEVNDK